MLLSGLAVFALASLAASTSLPPRATVHESRSHYPLGWTPVRRASPDTPLSLKIALTQPDLDRLGAYLAEVAHPDSPNYGRFWSHTEVATAFKPSAESVDAVRTWLVDDGRIDASRVVLTKSGSWIALNATVEEAERLLNTEYFVFEHTDGSTHVACKDAYHLPQHVSGHVDLITPTLHFAAKAKQYARVDHSIITSTQVDKVEVSTNRLVSFEIPYNHIFRALPQVSRTAMR